MKLTEEAWFPVSVDPSATCDPLESRTLAAYVGGKKEVCRRYKIKINGTIKMWKNMYCEVILRDKT